MTTRLQAIRDAAFEATRLADSWDTAADHRAAAEAHRRAGESLQAVEEANAWQHGEWARYHETRARTAADAERDRPVDGRHWCCICGALSDHFTGACTGTAVAGRAVDALRTHRSEWK